MKVYNLEMFCHDHIFRPYWPMWYKVLGLESEKAEPPNRELTKVLRILKENRGTTVWDMTMNRLALIGVTFPKYIKHPLVDYLKTELGRYESKKESKKECM